MSLRGWTWAAVFALAISASAQEPDEPPPEEPPYTPPPEEEMPPEEPPEEPPYMPPPEDPPPDQPPTPTEDPPTEKPTEKAPPENKPPDPPPVEQKPEPKPVDPEEEERKKKAYEAEVKKAVDDMNAVMRSGSKSESDKVSALAGVGKYKHRLVAEALTPWFRKDQPKMIRDTAIEAAKMQPFPESAAAAWRYFSEFESDTLYARSMLVIVGRTKDPKQLFKLFTLIRKKDAHVEHCRTAVDAVAEIGHRDGIADLIALLMYFEAPNYPPKEAAKKKSVQPAVEQALKKITGQVFMTGKQWNDWWKVNQKTFGKPPEPE